MKSILPKEIDYRFWRIMGLIMVIGTILRLTGYNFALPYIDTRDEATYLVGSLTLRGLYDQPLRLLGYPPGIYGVYSIAQLVIEGVTHASALTRPADIVQIVRLADIFIGLTTIPIIGLIARWLKGNYAGLMAAAAWAVIPIVVSQSSIAMPDAWLLFFSALSIYWALVGIEANWPGWLLLSILAGLGAVVFKYSTFPVLGPAVFVALWRLRSGKNPWLYIFLGQVFCIIGCAIILFGVFHAANLTTVGSEATTFTNSGASRAINIPLGTSLVSLTISQAGIIPLVAVALLFISVPFYFQQASTKQKLGWLLIAGFAFSSAWLTATYIDIAVEFGGYYLLSADIGLVILIAVAISVLGDAEKYTKEIRIRRLFLIGAAITTAIWLIPMGLQTWNNSQQQQAPDTRAAFQIWSANTLPNGSILIGPYLQRVLNREWGGYAGPYRVFLEQSLLDHPIPFWINEYVDYAALTDIAPLQTTSQGSTALQQMLLLKQFPPSDQRLQWRGPTISVYRLWRMEQEVSVDFGQQIRLLGYDFNTEPKSPSLHLTLYWKASTRPVDNYNVFIHLASMTDLTPLAQYDGTPLAYDRPTLAWDDPGETLISHDLQISIPSTLKPGHYRLNLGLYNYQTGKRLSTGDKDYVEIIHFSLDEAGNVILDPLSSDYF